jgi:hypothetical protein
VVESESNIVEEKFVVEGFCKVFCREIIHGAKKRKPNEPARIMRMKQELNSRKR